MEHYNAYNTLEYLSKFDQQEILIQTAKGFIKFTFNKLSVPHLLGLHYMYDVSNIRYISASQMFKEVINHHMSDEKILERVRYHNGEITCNRVAKRIENLLDFFQSLEEAILYAESSFNNSHSCILVKTKDDGFLELFVDNQTRQAYFQNYESNDCISSKSFLRSFIYESTDLKLINYTVLEPVTMLAAYSEKLESYISFSFNNEKNTLYSKVEKNELTNGEIKTIKDLLSKGMDIEKVEEYINQHSINEDSGLSL